MLSKAVCHSTGISEEELSCLKNRMKIVPLITGTVWLYSETISKGTVIVLIPKHGSKMSASILPLYGN